VEVASSGTVAERQDLFPKFAKPIINLWRNGVVDFPATIAANALKFKARRLQSQGDYLASVRNCASVPEVLDLNAQFMRQAVDEYRAEAERLQTTFLKKSGQNELLKAAE
jgi:hypothetical protein